MLGQPEREPDQGPQQEGRNLSGDPKQEVRVLIMDSQQKDRGLTRSSLQRGWGMTRRRMAEFRGPSGRGAGVDNTVAWGTWVLPWLPTESNGFSGFDMRT